MKTVALLHGWSGGKWHSKKFVQGLEDAGFKLIADVNKADIITAHSTGCYIIPKGPRASLILLTGVPYWPERSILSRMIKKEAHEIGHNIKQFGLGYVLKKYAWAIFYIVANPFYTLVVLKNHKLLDFLEPLKGRKVILVRTDNDHFSSPMIGRAVKHYSNIKYVKMPGGHDDHYINPKPYIDLILKEL